MNRQNSFRGTRGSVIGWLALLVGVVALVLAVLAVRRGVDVEEAVRRQVEETTGGLRDELAALQETVTQGAERAQEAVEDAAADVEDAAREGAERAQDALTGAQEEADRAVDETTEDITEATDGDPAAEGEPTRAQEADLAAAREIAADHLSNITMADTTTRQGRERALETVGEVREDLAAAYREAGAEDAWRELEPAFDRAAEALRSEPANAREALEALTARLEQ